VASSRTWNSWFVFRESSAVTAKYFHMVAEVFSNQSQSLALSRC
jgi:hypothetical protein